MVGMVRLLFPLFVVGAAVGPCLSAMAAPPNIVFILADDHAWQAVSAYGESRKLIETPNIDRIAREGMRFDRCLVTNAICGPSRATILTGKYSHLNGFYNNNNCVFDGSQTTFPKLLQQAGYQTFLSGKWHLFSEPTGFDKWVTLNNQGTYYNPTLIRNGVTEEHEGYATDLITDEAIEMLKHRDPSRPFLLMCHHKATHRAWDPAMRDLDYEIDRTYPEPATLFDDYAGRGSAERAQTMTIAKDMQGFDVKLSPPSALNDSQRKEWNERFAERVAAYRSKKPQGDDLVRWKYQRYMHDYLACVKSLDENVGRLLKFLDDEELADNTIVVYSSDQGFFLGEHGWFDKRWIFEESIRAPLVMRWPMKIKPSQQCDKIVSNVDFAETFLDAAGVAIPDDMQGRSFLPLALGEPPADWRKSFYYHYYEYPEPHRVSPHEGVVTDRYKLIHLYGADTGEYWELFDLEEDPQEMRSVYGEPAYQAVQQDLAQELQKLRSELKVPLEEPVSVFGGKTTK